MDIKKRPVTGGYPVGNFGICAQINSSGEFLSGVLINPSREGPWLEEAPAGSLTVCAADSSLRTSEFAEIQTQIAFPFASTSLTDSRLPALRLEIQTFAPIAAGDAFISSLPVLISTLTLHNSADCEQAVELRFALQATDELSSARALLCGFTDAQSPDAAPGSNVAVTVPAGAQRSVRFVYAAFDSEGFYAQQLSSVQDLVRYVDGRYFELLERTHTFSRLIPSTGDVEIDRWMRWYLPAAIYLTRITRNMVITMGYCEFNQRDSYWTSWVHLVFWPDLELQMLQETARHMRPDGKIPTTILPVIEREDDLDINCYFVLRVWRYWRFWRDGRVVLDLWPAVRKALEWLKARDTDADALIEQQSYWADWKDVPGVEGRKLAPHFEFTWLGALRGASEMLEAIGNADEAREYSDLADRVDQAVNRSVSEGGLWTGDFYTTQWRDGREDAHVQQDQLVGAAWDLIPPERLGRIYQSLTPNETPWGVRDTYPYRNPSNNEPGDYHNGGVWPFLNFMDALGRYKAGYPEQASEIIRRVGRGDLEAHGDFTPHEYMDGETGENRGPTIQGWNADIFAAILWGALGVEVLENDVIQIAPHLPVESSFETAVVLPQGVIWLEQKGGSAYRTLRIRSEADSDMALRIGLCTRKPQEGAVKLGSEYITWKSAELSAGTQIELSF